MEKSKNTARIIRNFNLELDEDVYLRFADFLNARGLKLGEFLELLIVSAVRPKHHYSSSDLMRFGKYYGAQVESVIRAVPDYIQWCLTNVEGFTLDPDAKKLHTDILAASLRPNS